MRLSHWTLAIMAVIILGTTTANALDTYTINLNPGWNNISTPMQLEEGNQYSFSEFISAAQRQGVAIIAMADLVNNQWEVYVPGSPINDNNIAPGKGYMVYAQNGGELELFGICATEVAKLTVTTDADTPDSALHLGGVDGQDNFTTQHRAKGQSIDLYGETLEVIDAQGNPFTGQSLAEFISRVDRIRAYSEAGTLLDSESPNFQGQFEFEFSTPVIIPKDSSESIAYIVDYSHIDEEDETGLRYKLRVKAVDAVDQGYSNTIAGYNLVIDAKSNEFQVVKSVPTFNVLPTAEQEGGILLASGYGEFVRWEESADDAGDTSIARRSVELTTNGSVYLEGTARVHPIGADGNPDQGVTLWSGDISSDGVYTLDFTNSIPTGGVETYALFLTTTSGAEGTLTGKFLDDDSFVDPGTLSELGSQNFIWNDCSDGMCDSGSKTHFSGHQIPGLGRSYTRVITN